MPRGRTRIKPLVFTVSALLAVASPGTILAVAAARAANGPMATASPSAETPPGGAAPPATPPHAKEGSPSGSPRVDRPAPDFALSDLRGVVVESDYGSRPVTVVHFWASWCVPCMREIPELNRLAERYEPSGAAIYAVAIGSGSASDLRQVEKAFHIRHRVLIGDENVARAFGNIPAFPVTFLIDGRGRIVERHEGATREAHQRIEATVRGLLAASGRPLPPKP